MSPAILGRPARWANKIFKFVPTTPFDTLQRLGHQFVALDEPEFLCLRMLGTFCHRDSRPGAVFQAIHPLTPTHRHPPPAPSSHHAVPARAAASPVYCVPLGRGARP